MNINETKCNTYHIMLSIGIKADEDILSIFLTCGDTVTGSVALGVQELTGAGGGRGH